MARPEELRVRALELRLTRPRRIEAMSSATTARRSQQVTASDAAPSALGETSPPAPFVAAHALAAVRSWLFAPARRCEVALESLVEAPVLWRVAQG